MVNYINPYFNPYGQQIQNYQAQIAQQMPQQQVVKVSGENGARAYQMGANSSALLLDECGTIVWLKTTDGAGFPTISPYDISPHKQAVSQDYVSLETRVARLEEKINESTSSTTHASQNRTTQADDERNARQSASVSSTNDSTEPSNNSTYSKRKW